MEKTDNSSSPGLSFPGRLWQDLRYGARTLVKNRSFATISIVSLGLGIGATTAIFSIFDTIWLRPLPYPNLDRLVAVSEAELDRPDRQYGVGLATYFDWKTQSRSFEHISIWMGFTDTLVGEEGAERVSQRRITEGYFDILGAKAVHGRLFLPEEYEEGAEGVLVLSHGFWQRMFGADPGVLGKRVDMEERSWTVVGVLPPEFPTLYGHEIDLWLPIQWRFAGRRNRHFGGIGRLAEGADMRTAQAELEVVSRRLGEQYPDMRGFGARVEPLRDYMYGGLGRRFVIFFTAVVFVLLIACANVANLMLVRASTREKEMAIRSSLGACRGRLIRQLLTESLLLSALGAALGLLIAFAGVKLLVGLDPNAVPRADEIAINVRILGFVLGVAVVTGLLFGVAPALKASKPDLNESLKETGRRAGARVGGRRAHGVLVMSEIALSLVLLIGAGLMIQSTWRMANVAAGFNTENLISMRVALPMFQYIRYIGGAVVRELLPQARMVREEVYERLGALPGVSSVSVSASTPLNGCLGRAASAGDQPLPDGRGNPSMVCLHPVGPEYFRTLQIPVLKGRGFSERDNLSLPPVAVVSEGLANLYFPGENPIGKVLKLARPNGAFSPEPPVEIVGVAAGVRQALPRQPIPAVYMPYTQLPARFNSPETNSRVLISFVVRSAVDPESLKPSMRRVVSEVAHDVVVLEVQTMDELRSLWAQRSRLYASLLAVFAGIAVTLAAVGVFGVMSYAVTRRTQEIGIRTALGAHPSTVLKLVMRQGLLMIVAGVAIGLGTALAVTRFLASLLFEVKPTEPSTFVAVSFLLCAVGLAACAIPAWRAARVSPTQSLRHE